ncbi:MAG: glycosyltransferase WbuB, partial [Xanthobacteraceae bacterium]|nr:glycosyltransferase WbuB [Xanthobacteraceae bacterium]
MLKQIVFLNRFFFPDQSATSQLVSDLAFHLADAGHDVHAITSRQRYDDPRADLAAIEAIRGVTIHRIATT